MFRNNKLAIIFAFLHSIAAFAEGLSIPVMTGQTGASMSFGKNEIDAYTLATEEWNARGGVNGKKVSLKAEDTQTNQQQIITAFHRLAFSSPPVIMGPTWLDGFQAVIPVARKRNVLLVPASAALEAFSKTDREWPVSFYHNSTQEVKVLTDGLKSRGFNNIAIIYEQEPFAELIHKLIVKNIPALKADIGVSPSQTSFQSVLTKLKASKPDVLIVLVWTEQSLLSLLQQIRLQISTLPVATIHDGEAWIQNPAYKPFITRLIYSKFIVSDSSFELRFKKRFGYSPILTASNAYDALNAVLSAYAAGKKTAKEIREYLLTQEHQTATFGKFKFAPDGSVPSKVEIVDFVAKTHE